MSPAHRLPFQLRDFVLIVVAFAAATLTTAAPASAVTVGGSLSIKGAGTVTNNAAITSSSSCDAKAVTANATTTACGGGTTYAATAYAGITYVATPKPGGQWKFVRWVVSPANACSGSTAPVCTISHSGANYDQMHYTVAAVFEDKTAPTLTPSLSYSTVADRTVNLTWTANELLSKSECSLNGAAFTSCPGMLGWTNLAVAEGSHTLAVRGTDQAGGADVSAGNTSAPVQVAFKVVDTTLASGPGAAANQTSQTFTFGTGAGTAFDCRLDAAEWVDCGPKGASGLGSKTLTGLSEGVHTFRVRARDGASVGAGVFDMVPVVVTWAVDVTAPVAMLTLGVGPGEGALQAADREAFQFTSSEKGSTFQCRLDAAAFAPCTSGQTVDNLKPGAHRFEVRAVDAAGNVSAPVARNWSVAPQDRDGDGFNRLIDCNDDDVAIRPGAIELKGNDVDENCDGLVEALPDPPSGGNAPGGSTPTPGGANTPQTQAGKPSDATVTANATATKTLTRFKALTLDKVPAGATVNVICKGAGCPKALKKKGVTKSLPTGGKLLLTTWVKTLRPGAVVTVTVTLGTQKATTTVTVRASKKPKITKR